MRPLGAAAWSPRVLCWGDTRRGSFLVGKAGVCAFRLTMECPRYVTVANKQSLAQGSLAAVWLLKWGPSGASESGPGMGF